MRRRAFITLLGGAGAAWALAATVAAVRERRHAAALMSRILQLQAESAANKISQFITEIVNQIGWTVQLPWSVGTMEQRRFDALRLLRQVPAVTELSFLDASGIEQLRVSRLTKDVVGSNPDLSAEPKFTEAVAHKVYFGPVYLRRESEPYMTVSLAGTRRESGVSVAEVGFKLVWDVVSRMEVGSGQAYVIDGRGRLIAHRDISLVLRSLLQGNTDFTGLPQVQAARAAVVGATAERAEIARDIGGREVLTAYAPVTPGWPAVALPPLGWHVFVELPLAEANTAVPVRSGEAG